MSVRLHGQIIHLEGECGVEDAEDVATALESGDFSGVNLSQCRLLHSAVVQALLALPCRLEGEPMEGTLSRFILPALEAAKAGLQPPALAPMERAE